MPLHAMHVQNYTQHTRARELEKRHYQLVIGMHDGKTRKYNTF